MRRRPDLRNPFADSGILQTDNPPEPPMPAPFIARATDDARAHAHPVPDASSAVEAAILFAERWLPDSSDGEVSITVTDCHTGHHQCFRIDLGEGSAEPC
jgi:hypothetical protein